MKPRPGDLDASDVAAAAARIEGHVHRTPVLASRTLDRELGVRLHFKCENFQRSGAFKMRGASNAVRSLAGNVATVATHSSGNHGAALALAARDAGLDAVVVVPANARPNKREAVRRYGARLVDCDAELASREATLAAVLGDTGATFVPPYDDDRIITGAGTAALELLEDCPALNQVWVPVGGGGLAAGTVLATAGQPGNPTVVLAEPALAGDAKASLERGERQPPMPPRSVADGLLTGLGERNFAILRRAGAGVALASEEAIRHWTQRIAEVMKVVVEPSAAVAVAAMAENPGVAAGDVGVVLSGGNL